MPEKQASDGLKQRGGHRAMPVVLALLLVRGVLLWLIVPVTVLCWLASWPTWRRRQVSLGQLLGWADLNLIALVDHTILRPFVKAPSGWSRRRTSPAPRTESA